MVSFYLRAILLITIFSTTSISIFANDFVKYRASFELENFTGDKVVLAHYIADKIYVDDTLQINKKGKFIFENDQAFKAGMYLLVMPPENNMLELIFNEDEPKFEMKANVMTAPHGVTFKGSKDNTLFYKYYQYMKKMNPELDTLNKQLTTLKEEKKETKKIEDQISKIRDKILDTKKDLIKNAPKNALTKTFLASQLELQYPKFEGTEKEVNLKKYYYRVSNFFNKLNGDKRFYRSKMFSDMTNFYVDKITTQDADSVYKSVVKVLDLVEYDEKLYNSYLIRFINKYVKPRIIGQDKVFVDLVDNYVIDKDVDFLKEETKTKIIDQANKSRNILIGKIAPDIKMFHFDYEGTLLVKDHEDEYKRFKVDGPFELHKFESPYTVLFFWKPNCGHCTKAIPKMMDFHEKYKDKGVEVVSTCIKTYKDMPACAQLIVDNKSFNWINTVDPFYRSNFAVKYDLTKTPKIYILDHKKEILIKNIGAEQIDRIMEQLLKNEDEKESNE